MDAFLDRAAETYAYTYFGALLAFAVVEWAFPRREANGAAGTRWLGNVGVAVLDAIVLRLLFPAAGVAWAAVCATRGWGLFNEMAIPVWAGIAVSISVLDFTSYAQHWLLHRHSLLWRIHLTHHTDQDVDFTTGLRFHPFEAVYTTTIRLGVIAVFGLPVVGVFAAELASLVVSLWEHSNTRVPRRLERGIRWLVVTPTVHRTHHSVDGEDSRSNFGNIFSCWDRMFGTYLDRPVSGAEEARTTGVLGYEDPKHVKLPWLLAQPFVGGAEPAVDDPMPVSSRAARTPLPGDPSR
jgi:sterol desaturase/sphingolipid hydroxylase (fatty acid hydroxylase superfamily)